MEFGFSREEEALLGEVRAFLKREVTPELRAECRGNGPAYGAPEARKFIKKFAANGWLVPNWPKSYGGLDASDMVTYMIKDEFAFHETHMAFIGAHMAGPTIMRFGSEELKREYLPRIARGEIEFCLGYTEPQAGSDLSSLILRAEDKGDHYLLNGQKTFNTTAHVADFHWLAVRTDLNVPKHKGISMMIVDLKSPGITIRPMITMAGFRTNEVYYDDVKVPKGNLVGEVNKGFNYLMTALDYERMFPPSTYRKLFEDVVEYTKESVVDGKPLSKDPLIRQKLAQIEIELEAAKFLYYQLPHMLDKGKIPNYQSSMEKVFATELAQHITQTCKEVLGFYGLLKQDSKWAPLAGRVEHYHRWSVVESIYAGTSEIQRNIIAFRGLNLPRE